VTADALLLRRGLIWCALILMGGLVRAAGQPNVVLIVADDLGYGDLGCHGSGINRTPHIDALAETGLRFTDFHSAGAMCSPTRAAMLTGFYQQRFGRLFDGALSGVRDRDKGLPPEAVTIAERLRGQGYATACFGKWHLGYRPPFLPLGQGFDEFVGPASGDGDHHTHIDRSGNEDWWHGDALRMEQGYTTDLLTRHGVRFIEKNRSSPFFLYLPHLAIHFPWQGPEDPPHRAKGRSFHQDKWGVIPDPANVASHVKAMIEALDAGVGEIMAALARLGLEKNTLVIFTSDNGGYLTYGNDFRNISSNGPLRGQKAQLYEGGHRVPAIFHWPGRIRPGVTSEVAHSVDLMPTLAKLAGDQIPPTDGLDLGPLLLRGEALPERMLFWRAGHRRAVRAGDWKLCREGGRSELYHLGEDLGETLDLAGKRPEKLEELEAAWSIWEADVDRSPRDHN
jgi:arylsulfatase A